MLFSYIDNIHNQGFIFQPWSLLHFSIHIHSFSTHLPYMPGLDLIAHDLPNPPYFPTLMLEFCKQHFHKYFVEWK